MNPKALNDRQRRFAEFVVSGMSGGRAYEAAGYGSKGNVADSAAERLLRNVEVEAYLVELRKPQKAAAVATRQSKRERLYKIMTGRSAKDSDVIRAIQADNAMTGDNQPVKIEGELTIHRILKSIKGGRLSEDE